MSDASTTTRRRRDVPVVTIIFMVLAIASPFLLSAIFGSDGVPAGWLLIPPTLGVIGAMFSRRHQSLGKSARSGWAIASVVTGFLTVPAVFLVAMVIEAIDWTINGPPSSL